MRDKKAPKRRMRIQEIAAEAKLSKTAVSYALNGTGRLQPGTRARVLEIARKNGYQANLNARNLRRQSFGVLSVSASVPPAMTEALPGMSYFLMLWQGAVARALERGYMLLLTPFGTRPEMFRNMPVDGGIVIDPVVDDPVVGHFEAQQLPVVTIGRDIKRPIDQGWWVDSPHGALATDVFNHLTCQGARRIGLILAPRQYSYSVAVRQSYNDWIASTGGESLIAEVDGAPMETAGYTAAMELLKADAPPDAIYAALDRLAVGALFAAEHCGLKVPQDLLLGAGSDGVTRNATLPITALDLQPHKLGQIAVSLLIDRIEQGIEPRQVTVPGKIEVRASTTPV